MYGDTRVITADQIITMDPARPRAEAVAVSGGRITAVGSIAGVPDRDRCTYHRPVRVDVDARFR